MKEHLTFSFIGGDLRQLRAISLLTDEGFRVRVFGFGEETEKIGNKVYVANSMKDCISNADVIVLPLPYTTDRMTINTPLTSLKILIDDVVAEIQKDVILFAGIVDEKIKDVCDNREIPVYDYASREEMAVMNAVPTAEGAIETAMANTPYTIRGSKCLVVGYGRIGRVLSADLRGMGAKVTATSRNKATLCEVLSSDYTPMLTDDIKSYAHEFDIIFNTVPDMILGSAALAATREDVLIIDLASRPGGVDFDEAKRLGRRVIWALSLPGKVAPYTAGKIIKDTIMNVLEELGV